MHPVLTIGHSTHPIETFAALLGRHDVTVLIDVRSMPRSRFNPQFNRNALEQSLKTHGIRYLFLGSELGARPRDPAIHEQGRVQYARLKQSDRFRSGIERVMHEAGDERIALMCAEKEPLECHRTLLVAPELVRAGISVQHILADGRLEPHDETMTRLIDLVGLPHKDLLRSREELVAEALTRQEERVAYRG